MAANCFQSSKYSKIRRYRVCVSCNSLPDKDGLCPMKNSSRIQNYALKKSFHSAFLTPLKNSHPNKITYSIFSMKVKKIPNNF